MNKILPDKWIRKAISDLINDITVNTETIPCFDTRVVARQGVFPDFYTVMTTQSNLVDKNNKCEYHWDSEILLDIRATYSRTGNSGSRVMVDDMANEVRNLIQNVQLDAGSGLTVINRTFAFLADLAEETESNIVYRKILSVRLLIN
jgi:hypothetical protein